MIALLLCDIKRAIKMAQGLGLMVTVAKWDAAEVLTSPERIAAYLEVALEDDDPEVLKVALGNIARAKGMAEIAKKAGVRRTSLYRALSPALSLWLACSGGSRLDFCGTRHVLRPSAGGLRCGR